MHRIIQLSTLVLIILFFSLLKLVTKGRPQPCRAHPVFERLALAHLYLLALEGIASELPGDDFLKESSFFLLKLMSVQIQFFDRKSNLSRSLKLRH